MSRIISVVSGKGGCGKTFLSTNLLYGFVNAESKCLLIDCSFGIRNCSSVLVSGASVLYNLKDVLNGEADFDEAVIKDAEKTGSDFIAGSPEKCPHDLYDKMKSLLVNVSDMYDYIIIDTPSSIGIEFDVSTSLSDIIVAVTCPDFASVSNTALVLKGIEDIADKSVYTVINMPYRYESQGYIEDVIDEIGYRLIGVVTHDEKIYESTQNREVIINSDSHTAKELMNIVKRIKNEFVQSAKLSLSERLLEKIKTV